MLLTHKIKHGRDFTAELIKARKVAEYTIEHNSRTSKDVKHIGLPSAISCQVVRKYGRNRSLKKIRSVVLTVSYQRVRVDDERKELYISCLKLRLDISHLPSFEKVNQVELDKEYAHVTVTINEPPVREVEQWVGVDLNSTGHVAVAANPTTGKVQKYGKEAPHIHRKYSKMRRRLHVKGHHRVAKKKIRNKENRKIKDINHKISRAIVDQAAQQACGIKLERLSDIRTTARTFKSSRHSLHSWSFYQLQQMIEYKAKLLGVPVAYVDPAYTSRECSRCGRLGARNGKDFTCPQCGHVDHADVNASFNIALRPSIEEGVGRLHADRVVCKGLIDVPRRLRRERCRPQNPTNKFVGVSNGQFQHCQCHRGGRQGVQGIHGGLSVSAQGEAVLQMTAHAPFMALRLSGSYIHMKHQVKKARRTFCRELMATGMSPRDAGRLADEYASAASLRTVLRTFAHWTG